MTNAVSLASAAGTGFSFRNRIINGAMEINQRGTGIVTLTSASQYTVDRWTSVEDTDGTMTVRQTTNAPVGFQNALYFETGTADESLSAAQFVLTRQAVEGFNIADLAWGTAAAKAITVSFWVRSSLTGTFCGSIRNGAANRSYPFTYTISSANTYEYKTITITGDTTGTWATDNTAGLSLIFSLGAGSNYNGTANTWQTGNILSVADAVSIIGTASANFYLTGVQLEVGSVATTFERRPYGLELALCQRYYETGTQPMLYIGFGATGIGAAYGEARFAVTKRANPTISSLGWQYYSGGGGVSFTPTATSLLDRFYWANAGFTNWNGWTGSGTWAASAEL